MLKWASEVELPATRYLAGWIIVNPTRLFGGMERNNAQLFSYFDELEWAASAIWAG